jgi:hypothetical protein
MKLIGNFSDWITEELVNHLVSSNGDTVPVWQPDRWRGNPMLDDARERARWGYSNNKHNFQQFNTNSPDMQNYIFDFKIPDDNRKLSWWFVKLLPGQMQAMHFDPHLIECKNPNRYTMFLQDWQPGHIFTWNDSILTNYKAGDLYRWLDPMCYHGVVNIGYETRLTLQITTYD